MTFVQRSSLQLTSLSVQSLALSCSNLVHLLIHLPILKYLTLDDSLVPPEYSPISSELIENLHCSSFSSSLPSQISPIVPRLYSLRLLNIGATDFRDTSVVDMVQSRWMPEKLLANNVVEASTLQVDCLREFTLGFRNRSEKETDGIYNSLDQIEKDGMRIVVSWDTIQ
ncbi:hypothetical protein BDP27DRAFT_1440523 [Rhodocollybia butyracea]|uniref:Uncharacterized protein n=1 Tax=Rhodocollybia butyracea TaxID=206335 RepID=A0A9P5P420_9AGAR|nr:hypothetical protein BDP27DRAFT_1440523 [Rhodocollybia butyracea]